MAIQIIGRKVESNLDEVLIERAGGVYAHPRKIDALPTAVEINPGEYALVQEGTQANSAMSMRQRFNGLKHKDTIVTVLKSGFFVPNTKKFITQYKNVNEALQGRGVLYDASGVLIEGKGLKQYSQTLNHDCWVWLNDSFEKGEGFLGLDVITATGLKDGKLIFQREPLEDCLQEDGYADLESVNNQGFPTKKSPVDKYELGKSIYFWHPRKDLAVRFYADPVDAALDCGRYPQYSYSELGVFDYAEGAEKNK